MVRYTMKSMKHRIFRILFQIAVIMICFYMIDASINDWYGYFYFYTADSERLLFDPKRSGRISVAVTGTDIEKTAEELQTLWNRLVLIPEICKIGSFFAGEAKKGDDWIHALYLTEDLWDMGKLELTEGAIDPVKNLDAEGYNQIPVILGNSQGKGHHIGDVIRLEIGFDSEESECVIAGILKPGSTWFAEYQAFQSPTEILLDHWVLIPVQPVQNNIFMQTNILGSDLFYEVSSEDAMENAASAIGNAMKESGISGANESLEHLLTGRYQGLNERFHQKKVFAVLIYAMTMMYLMISCILDIIDRKKEFAVLYAVGFYRWKTGVILFLENLLKILIAVLPAFFLREMECREFAKTMESMGRAFLILHRSTVAELIALSSMGLIIILTVIPIWIVGRRSIMQLFQTE